MESEKNPLGSKKKKLATFFSTDIKHRKSADSSLIINFKINKAYNTMGETGPRKMCSTSHLSLHEVLIKKSQPKWEPSSSSLNAKICHAQCVLHLLFWQ